MLWKGARAIGQQFDINTSIKSFILHKFQTQSVLPTVCTPSLKRPVCHCYPVIHQEQAGSMKCVHSVHLDGASRHGPPAMTAVGREPIFPNDRQLRHMIHSFSSDLLAWPKQIEWCVKTTIVPSCILSFYFNSFLNITGKLTRYGMQSQEPICGSILDGHCYIEVMVVVAGIVHVVVRKVDIHNW